MTRHINLMQADILPGQGPIQLPVLVLAVSAALLAGGAYLGFHAWTAAQLSAETSDWQQQVDDSQRELHRLRQSMPGLASEQQLRAENEALLDRLAERQAEFSGLTNQFDTASSGFATPLDSLAKHDLDGLWLTRIELRNSHSHLELEGLARRPGLIPLYLGQLEGAVFQGLSIRNLNIEQQDDQLWRFAIAETLDSGEAEAETEAPAPDSATSLEELIRQAPTTTLNPEDLLR